MLRALGWSDGPLPIEHPAIDSAVPTTAAAIKSFFMAHPFSLCALILPFVAATLNRKDFLIPFVIPAPAGVGL